ncbi:MAG: cell wall surface anchor family protein [Parcubacteria group bacterium Athens0416_74]|nr:MAG: cell wall surface anchor family protein [Parcubacteria group bacterium Athens0416_74]
MENSRVGIAIVLTFAINTVPVISSAYSVSTHEGLTQVIIDQYEKIRGDVFTSEQAAAAVHGSNKEDEDWRFMQHFYDPINNKGLWGKYISSKEWVQNTDKQGGELGYAREYFSRNDDYTWDRAIFDYAYGNKVRAAEALGHVLHLVEDASVPAHVRDDAHGNIWGIGNPDTYEKFTGIFEKGSVNIVGKIISKKFSSLSQAFEDTASFSNKNFVTNDVMFSEYASPSVNTLVVKGEFAYHAALGHVVARAVRKYDRKLQKSMTSFEFDDPSSTVSLSYWNLLSRHAVESGIGVIDLFFREVEKEKQTGALKAKNLSPLQQHNKKLASGFSLVKAIYGSSLTQDDVNELLSDAAAGQAGAAALAIGEKAEPIATQQPVADQTLPAPRPTELPAEPAAQEQSEPAVPTERNSSVESQTVSSGTSTTSQLQPLVPVTPGFGGGGGGNGGSTSQAEEVVETSVPDETPTPVVVPVSLEVLSPHEGDFFATTTVAFSGITEAHGLVTLESNANTATTTADGAGSWSSNISLEEGNPTVAVSATDSAGERATSTIVDVFVDITPPSLATVSLPQCSNSLTATFCLIATTSVTVQWESVADATSYAVAVDGIVGATTTATSSFVSVSFSASSTIAVIAYDAAGNTSTSTSEMVYAIERPLIIYEVAWAGTDANATDEWIEIKNVSAFDVDLSKVSLSVDGTSSALSGTLNAGALYLIEDRAEAMSKTHNLALDMDLPDTGALIVLSTTDGTVLDSTPDVAACSGWCSGSSSATIGASAQFGELTAKLSMERKDPITDGTLASSWQSNDTYIRISPSKATDSATESVYGTPGMTNSAGLPAAGWDCGSGTLTTAGGSYNPTSDACTYLSAFVSTQANRYGDVYRGTVGSSTLMSGHSLSKSIQSSQNDAGIVSGAVAGDQFFVAIYETRNGPAFSTDLTDFRNYMKTGVGTTPHGNYVTIPWTYAP